MTRKSDRKKWQEEAFENQEVKEKEEMDEDDSERKIKIVQRQREECRMTKNEKYIIREWKQKKKDSNKERIR